VTSLEAALRKISTELTQAGVPFALVGGLAVSVRTEPRFTRDADLVVALATDAEPIDLLPQLRMGVARTGHLIALKVLSREDVRRPQDIVDLRALLAVASPAELEGARKSLSLIAARGYHRGRDLALEIDRLLLGQ
jgi:hypothetical protein